MHQRLSRRRARLAYQKVKRTIPPEPSGGIIRIDCRGTGFLPFRGIFTGGGISGRPEHFARRTLRKTGIPIRFSPAVQGQALEGRSPSAGLLMKQSAKSMVLTGILRDAHRLRRFPEVGNQDIIHGQPNQAFPAAPTMPEMKPAAETAEPGHRPAAAVLIQFIHCVVHVPSFPGMRQ